MPEHPVSRIFIVPDTPEQQSQVQTLAQCFDLPWRNTIDEEQALYLLLNAEYLALQETGKRAAGAVFVDFVSGAVAHRRRFGGGRGQALARAAGLKKGKTPTIVDATAGLGRDAFVLASLGCQVMLLERCSGDCRLIG
ncbi:class I SAM-dependent methyltransferase [Candidatus Venteria ishoeyi]|uniref:Ribosomal RNA small subunit methyltransferase J n=1 Tax=Candidatus Venteria ishoeyi TaxID=1899563 RepID=A0A1H6FCR6_9GAMM|nr:class I SAM-dependent methyltransferase [Candidatus Venteria ishoeyi]SEH07868.1 Ribosomal RNA small subunit methyltransferase J [Candidatus Venteria ishoeyi]